MDPHMLPRRIAASLAVLAISVAAGAVAISRAQEEPRPYRLSQGVQTRALELQLWVQIEKTAGRQNALQRYLDVVTVADVIAIARAQSQRKKAPDRDDYDVGLAASCVPVPNKPLTPVTADISRIMREKTAGIYLDEAKRRAFLRAVNPEFLKVSKARVFRMMSQFVDIPGWNSGIVNTAGF